MDKWWQLSVELFGVDDWDFGVVALDLLLLVGVELWVAAIAAPPPTVKASTAEASSAIRLGLRMAPPFWAMAHPYRSADTEPQVSHRCETDKSCAVRAGETPVAVRASGRPRSLPTHAPVCTALSG